MASCMECIHFNPCNMHGKIIVEKPTEGNDWGLHNEVENECKYFTPTTDEVEVVRCKDCKHATFYSCKNDACYNSINCEYQIGVGDENFFCSCGERRANERLD